MPKGHIEAGESPEAAAMREVLEETGLTATVVGPAGKTQYSFRRSTGFLVRKTVHWFLMETQERTLAVEPIFREARFVPPAEAARLLTFAKDRALLDRVLSRDRERGGLD